MTAEEIIREHNNNPRNYGKINEVTHYAKGQNDSSGDEIEVYLNIQENLINNISYELAGGAVFTASASMMSEEVKGLAINDALKIKENFVNVFLDKKIDCSENTIGELHIFCGIRQFPSRVRCVSLPWITLDYAINNIPKIASSEYLLD